MPASDKEGVLVASDWIVHTVTALKDACDYSVYRLRVEGTNLNYPEGDVNRKFSWLVHDVADPRYDLTFASVSGLAKKWLDKPGDPFACEKCEVVRAPAAPAVKAVTAVISKKLDLLGKRLNTRVEITRPDSTPVEIYLDGRLVTVVEWPK